MKVRLNRSRRAATLAIFLVANVHAQYKWVSPEGTVTYGDRMPPAGAQVLAIPPGLKPTAGFGGTGLPYALRSATERFPVTLYTTARCEPCDLGRAHLNKRGIPFTESIVTRQAEIDALRKIGISGTMFPVLQVSRENTDGFEPGTWDRILDGGGYPRASMLPHGYRPSQARALVALNASRRSEKSEAPETTATASADAESGSDTGTAEATLAVESGLPLALPLTSRAESPSSRPSFRF